MSLLCFQAALVAGLLVSLGEAWDKKKHHHHGHHHRKYHSAAEEAAAIASMRDGPGGAWRPAAAAPGNVQALIKAQESSNMAAPAKEVAASAAEERGEPAVATEDVKPSSEQQIMKKMQSLETELAKKEEAVKGAITRGRIVVNGPLPADFAPRFASAVAGATGCDPTEVKVIETNEVVTMFLQTSDKTKSQIIEVVFEAPADVVKMVEEQSADPDSKLATGSLKSFLVAKDEDINTPVQEKGIDVDTEMPYGELEPFGREDTAQELTEQSIRESDEMVDQLERAEVAEEKRSVFRALTRLRGAAITSFDGIARSQTGNIDEYNKTHKWRKTHPLHHLADEESDISKWAFPDNADML